MRTHFLFPMLVSLVLAAACGAARADPHDDDQKRCAGYGFKPGSDEFAKCMMKLDGERREKADKAGDDDARMKALSIKRNGDTRYKVCSAAMLDANLDTLNNAWYGPNCREK